MDYLSMQLTYKQMAETFNVTHQLGDSKGHYKQPTRTFDKQPTTRTCHKYECLADCADFKIYC